MDNRFFVYALLNPMKTGTFKYGKYEFEHEPFYIGKGCDDRIKEHLRPSSMNFRNFKNKVIKKIIAGGAEPLAVVISNNMFECDAFSVERSLISTIGRRDKKAGPLTNLTDGGEGVSGQVRSASYRKKISDNNRNRIVSELTRKKISESLRGKIGRNTGNRHSLQTKKKISKSKMGQISWNAAPVLQIDKHGNVMREWRSSKHAAESLGLSQGNIWGVINGTRRQCGGFGWKNKN